MKVGTKIAAAAIVLLFLGLGQQVQAYWGPFGNGWNGNGWMGGGGGQFDGLGGGGYRYESGYQAGISDAIYDHENNLAYNPVGQCLSCHSELYWHNFHQGYDHQWNSYQNQVSTQGTSINIYGSNNYVSTSQNNNQQENPLQQLAHTVCGLVNCNGLTGSGYDGPIVPQEIGYGGLGQ